MKIVETPNIAVISSDESFHAFMKYHFEDSYELHYLKTEKEALEKVGSLQPAIIISSSKVEGNLSGIDILIKTKETSPKSKRILMTDDPSQLDFEKAVNRAEIFRMMTLPFEINKVGRILDEATLAYAERLEYENEIERLTRVSQQLEFQLRQSLIS